MSPESVRLLHNFYTELDAATSLSQTQYIDCPVHELANHISIRRQLEGRHLNVLINLIMLMVEEEQKSVQLLLKFYTLLMDDDRSKVNPISAYYSPDELIGLKALTQVQMLVVLS